MQTLKMRSKAVPVAALLASIALSAFFVASSWSQSPIATAVVSSLCGLGAGLAVRQPKNAVGYSVTLGTVLGIFLGAAIILVRALHAR